MSYSNIVKLLDNIAALLIPLFGFRFSQLGSIYKGPAHDSAVPTPRAPSAYTPHELSSAHTPPTPSSLMTPRPLQQFHVGQIISWPFFGSNRGELQHPEEINRGPWSSSYDYLLSCTQREINGVILENAGKSAPHRLHLDPDEIRSSYHHHLRAVPGDQSDDSDEYDMEESEEEWDGGAGDTMYSDYRRMQRSTFLIAHLRERENRVREEMARFLEIMERLGVKKLDGPPTTAETFALDCHDLNLENIFVDEKDNTKIVSRRRSFSSFALVLKRVTAQACIIDWESTTTRPLWACAHAPAFLNNNPFTTRLYRQAVVRLANKAPATPPNRQQRGYFLPFFQNSDVASLAKEWLFYEESGARLRMAHRCMEWDGWEEGLVESILGPEDEEEDWFKEWEEPTLDSPTVANPEMYGLDSIASMITLNDHHGDAREGAANGMSNGNGYETDEKSGGTGGPAPSRPKLVPDGKLGPNGIGRKKLATKVVEEEKAKESSLGLGAIFAVGLEGSWGEGWKPGCITISPRHPLPGRGLGLLR